MAGELQRHSHRRVRQSRKSDSRTRWARLTTARRGPNWIHGIKDNPIYDLAKKTKTTTCSFDGHDVIFDGDGTALSTKEGNEIFDEMWRMISEATTYSAHNGAKISETRSLWDYFLEEARGRFPGDEESAKRKEEILLKMCRMWGCFVGTEIENQSLKFFWLEENVAGETVFVVETYRKILNHLSKPALERAHLRLKRTVDLVRSEAESGDKRITVRTTDGDEQEFDEVVVTAPLGWLKQNLNSFEPPLPERMRRAIHMLGYGNLEKVLLIPCQYPGEKLLLTAIQVYLFFETAWWNPPRLQDENSRGPANTGVSHPVNEPEQHHSDPSAPPQGFFTFLSPEYAPDTNPQKWMQEAVDLSRLPLPTAHPTLLFYTCGSNSRHIASSLAALPPSGHLPFLADFFRPYLALLPRHRPGDPACEPAAALATAWAADALAGNGSYTNFRTGLAEGAADLECIREGCPGRGVWFAGEHAAPVLGLGTVTGAYWSGESVAGRVAEAYGV